MLTIELSFPAGRYHATPWDHHVNEGVVEYPPSPWRLLRALLAVWYLKAADEVDEATMRSLLERLAGDVPSYRLPAATSAHTRHYMPLAKANTTKVFDTFLHLGPAATVTVEWPSLELTTSEESALELLLHRMGYLGRAESWVEARLGGEGEASGIEVAPLDEGPPEGEIVHLLAPETAAVYANWRCGTLERRLEAALGEHRSKARDKGKPYEGLRLPAGKRRKIEASLPLDLFAAVQAETSSLRTEGWSQPPGSRWVAYCRPREATSPSPAPRSHGDTSSNSILPTVARFAFAGAVLPPLTEALWVAEKLRTALMSRSEAASVFSGRDGGGRLLDGHRHAFILAEANDRRRPTITHVTLFAPMGFDGSARHALDTLEKVWGRRGHDLQLVLLGVGRPMDFAGLRVSAGQCPLFARASTWISRTPFIATRHPKTTRAGRAKLDELGLQLGSPEHDLRRLLAAVDRPEPQEVRALAETILAGRPTRWLAFRTERRQGGGRRAVRAGLGFRVTFPEEVAGPLALGFGAHYGLGVFVPEGVF